jgi:hypothetical protein
VDAYRWPELDELTQVAVLDHELTHLELVTDDEGTVKYDDYGRPKLRMRLHDICHGWFSEVAKRHKGTLDRGPAGNAMITEHEEFIPGISVAATTRKQGSRVTMLVCSDCGTTEQEPYAPGDQCLCGGTFDDQSFRSIQEVNMGATRTKPAGPRVPAKAKRAARTVTLGEGNGDFRQQVGDFWTVSTRRWTRVTGRRKRSRFPW